MRILLWVLIPYLPREPWAHFPSDLVLSPLFLCVESQTETQPAGASLIVQRKGGLRTEWEGNKGRGHHGR